MRKDDKGFTLVELLIAVIIMAIVAVPLLHGFVTSYRVNARSREMMRATTLAQNEMEIFEKEKLEVLLDGTTYDYNVDPPETYSATDPATGEVTEHTAYTFRHEGIVNDESGREMFDVVVKLDPESDLTNNVATDLYYDKNTEQLLYMNSLSGVDSATYVQRIRHGETNGEDEEVYQLYVNRQLPDGTTGSNYSVTDFARELQRTITVTIEQTNQNGFETTVAKVNYRYRCDYGQVPTEYRTYTGGDKVIFNNSQTLDDEGNPIDLKSVYLFYAPRYDYAVGTPITGSNPVVLKEDKIVIENPQSLPVNVYIIRQNILNDAGDILGIYTDDLGVEQNTVPDTYVANIEINEGLNGAGKTSARYFTNLDMDPYDAINNGETKLTLNDTNPAGGIYNGNEAAERAGFRSLGSTESMDRIYTMDVSVYTHGADPTADDPLVRMTGTKIE